MATHGPSPAPREPSPLTLNRTTSARSPVHALTPVVSSLSAGVKMEGLSVFKDVPDPVALPEDQYPKWLWTLLDQPKGVPATKEGERNFMAERKVMREK